MTDTKPMIALVGPGAVGGTVAAWLDRTGRFDLTLCARTPLAKLAVDTPEGTIDAAPRVLTDPAAATPVDWVLVATKAYDVAGAARWLAGLVGPSTRVAVLQNGVEHVARFAGLVPTERIVPVMVDIPAEREAPGRIRQRRRGWMIVPEGPDGAAFVALFAETALDVTQTDDFMSAVWRKLCINSAGAVSALTNEAAAVAWREPAAEVMRALVRECIAVGRAEGADLDDGLVDSVVQGYRDAPGDSMNSIHADRVAGRAMEWDARNGVVCRQGRHHGIATPVSDTIAGLLAAIDEAARARL
jgi:2-dehydropantoate 2-reductase